MGSSSYLSTLYTVILLLRVWGRTVTRKNGKNSDHFFNSNLQRLKRHFPKPISCPIQNVRKPYFHEKYILEI